MPFTKQRHSILVADKGGICFTSSCIVILRSSVPRATLKRLGEKKTQVPPATFLELAQNLS